MMVLLKTILVFSLIGLVKGLSSSDVDCFAIRDSGYICAENQQSQMFYYLPRLGTCQPFMFNGCGGNSNRFSSAQECRDVCSNAKPRDDSGIVTDQVMMKSACAAEYDTDHLTPTRCQSNQTQCPNGYQCVNGFCCGSAEHICNLNYDSGKFAVGGEKSDKYFWVPKYNTCMRFSFYGSLGNENNFPDYNSCMRMCSQFSH